MIVRYCCASFSSFKVHYDSLYKLGTAKSLDSEEYGFSIFYDVAKLY